MEKLDFMELAINAIADSDNAEAFADEQDFDGDDNTPVLEIIKAEIGLQDYGQIAEFADTFMHRGEILWVEGAEYGFGYLFSQRDTDVLNVYVAAVKPEQADAFAKAAHTVDVESTSSTALQHLAGIQLFQLDGYYSSWDATDWSNSDLDKIAPYLRKTVGFHSA